MQPVSHAPRNEPLQIASPQEPSARVQSISAFQCNFWQNSQNTNAACSVADTVVFLRFAILWCAVVGVLDPRGQSDGLLKTACCTNVIKAHGVQFQQSSESTSRPSNLDRTRTALQRRHNEEALLQTVDGDAGSADTATGKRNTRPKGGGLPNDSASTVAQEQLVTWCTTKMLGPDSADAGCRRLTAVLLVPE
jgi:hypothetical protein